MVQQRKQNEDEVEKQNKLIATSIKDIFAPVAKKLEMPINIEICEKRTLVHLDFIYNTRTTNINPRITLNYPSAYEILLNKSHIETYMKKIEGQIRLVKKAIGKTEESTLNRSGVPKTIRNRLLISNPGKVSVKFSTRTRYF